MEFKNTPPEWTQEGVQPPDEIAKDTGWLAGYKPPASYFNWFFHKCYVCIKELQEKLSGVDKQHTDDVAAINENLDLKAPLASPKLTGVPQAPTADKGTATEQIATTKFVNDIVGDIDFSALQGHTKYVTNANLNALIEDQAYICVGTLTNAPIANTYCLVRAYDTDSTNRVVQICYVPQTDNSVRTFVRSTVGGSVFGKWTEYGNVKSVNSILPDSRGNVEIPVADAAKYGVVRVAAVDDVLSEDVMEAAITPAVYHEVSDFRHHSTSYSVGDKVRCMFNFELFLECTQGGTTSESPLDTRAVTHGQVITDGTVKWTVRTHIKSVNGVVAGADGNVVVPKGVKDVSINGKTLTITFDDGTTKTLTTQDTDTVTKLKVW